MRWLYCLAEALFWSLRCSFEGWLLRREMRRLRRRYAAEFMRADHSRRCARAGRDGASTTGPWYTKGGGS